MNENLKKVLSINNTILNEGDIYIGRNIFVFVAGFQMTEFQQFYSIHKF